MKPTSVVMGTFFVGTVFVLAPVAILLGLFLYRGELALALYAAIWAAAVTAWVVRREEPELRRRFGEAYLRYAEQVPRWMPRRPRRTDG